ncbi:hypothetical protein SKAU_G00023290 [Synaphobranchus kaupii]|uniref:Proline and serine rich 2 n=1 Tax=Synaphobranchus kaupii TaxID=118154 RepID=A0A9Q1JCF1_SYNKA|nr:hypothetical protein SKAU_G00023290 [Synaphobranchus kaupii]
MDFHVPSDPRLQFGLNGSQESSRRNSAHRRSFEDEALRFLSREEKECILFFEETIDSLDDDSEDPGLGLSSGSSTSVEGRSATPSPVPVTGTERSPSPKEQDIIDLVQNRSVRNEPKEVLYDPPIPDFLCMAVKNPETHFEIKAKQEPLENFPSEFHHLPPSPYPSVPSEESLSHSLYQPAGSIPTPVLIAQRIAEHQGGGSTFSSSSFLSGRRTSVDSQSPPPDSPVKQGPPTLAKPTRFPDKISFIIGNRDYNQTIAKASVNVNERRAKVLSNLTGGPLAPEPEERLVQNIPNRSVSFRDPAPDRSRMEALSKLGLTHKRSFPGTNSRVVTSNPQSTTKPETSSSNVSNYDSKPKAATPSLVSTTTSTSDYKSYGGKSKVPSPSSMLPNKTDATSQYVITNETKPNLVSQSSLDGGSPVDFNSYGGKTIIMTPSVGSMLKSDSTSQRLSNYESRPSALGPPQMSTAARTEASLSDFNSYGGKSKVMTPATASTAKTKTSSDCFVPHDSKARVSAASLLSSYKPETSSDCFVTHDSKARVSAASLQSSYKPEAFPSDSSSAANINSYGGKSKAVTPSLKSSPKPEVTTSDPWRVPAQPSVTPRPHYRVEPRPAEAPRPLRQEGTHSSFGGGLHPEARRRPVSKPSLFHQGITVQFSGRGATDESRREALRKLGLLKDTP